MGCKTATNVVTKIKIPKIPKYQVVMLNDDITTMEFVVRILIEIFGRGLFKRDSRNQIFPGNGARQGGRISFSVRGKRKVA